MEDHQLAPNTHKILLCNRQKGAFSGVLDVISFDLSAILLETEMGMLQVKGQNLHVNRLNLEKGEVDIDGEIVSLEYQKVPKTTEKGKSMLGRIFG